MGNTLLASLPSAERERLAPFLESVEVPDGAVLMEAGQPIEYVWFPDRGVCAIVQIEPDGRHLPFGLVGFEGLTGFEVWLRQPESALASIAYIGGSAQRMRAEDLRREVVGTASLLNDAVAHFIFRYIKLASQMNTCGRRHGLEERLCRWLSMVSARLPGMKSFPLSEVRIADLLLTERSTASITARILRNAGLIEIDGDTIHILDEQGLREGACECLPIFHDHFLHMHSSV